MRALGIPCRPVTNFSSAHDTQANCTNDNFLDENGEKINELSTDSVWYAMIMWHMFINDLANQDGFQLI